MFDFYLWVKAFHVIAVMFWLAGLYFLPRLFVYHSSAQMGGELEAKMVSAEIRLLKIIMTPAMLVALIFGLILLGYRVDQLIGQFWLLAKLVLVFGLIGYHFFLAGMQKAFARGERPKSEKFFRVINEIPPIVTIIIVVLAIVEPF